MGALNMAAIARAFARAFPSISTADEHGLGLLASLVLVLAFGIDLSATDLF
jgi:hypothetical protein